MSTPEKKPFTTTLKKTMEWIEAQTNVCRIPLPRTFDPKYDVGDMIALMLMMPDHYFCVNDNYQRPLCGGFVAGMSKVGFDPHAIQPLTGMLRSDGMVEVSNGRQRRELWTQYEGMTELPVMLHTGMTPEQTAMTFVRLNSTKRVGVHDKFRAHLFGRNPLELGINAIVNSLGFSLRLKPGPVEPDQLRAVGAVLEIHGEYGDDGLRDTLTVLRRAFCPGKHVQPKALHDRFVLGLAHYLGHYDKTAKEAIRELAGASAKLISDKAFRLKPSRFDQAWEVAYTLNDYVTNKRGCRGRFSFSHQQAIELKLSGTIESK